MSKHSVKNWVSKARCETLDVACVASAKGKGEGEGGQKIRGKKEGRRGGTGEERMDGSSLFPSLLPSPLLLPSFFPRTFLSLPSPLSFCLCACYGGYPSRNFFPESCSPINFSKSGHIWYVLLKYQGSSRKLKSARVLPILPPPPPPSPGPNRIKGGRSEFHNLIPWNRIICFLYISTAMMWSIVNGRLGVC